jgi:hypothetical protein
LPELTTNQKGAIAEGGRFDMIFVVGGRLVRVQCKWARLRGNVLSVPCYSSRRAPEGFRHRVYTADEIDALAAYCPDVGHCYFLPIERFPGYRAIQLRVTPSRNNQQARINWASDFEFGATLRPTGP